MYTEIHRGKFVSTGANKFIPLVTDVDWMNVYNWTAINTGPAASNAIEFYWQRDMAENDGLVKLYTGAGTFLISGTSSGLSVGGFTLYDSSTEKLLAPVTITAISAATPPVVATGTTTGLVAGDVVRLSAVTGANQVGGIDFTIGSVVGATSFTLAYMRGMVAAPAAGTNAAYRKIKYDAGWYPRKRYITKISKAVNAIVTMSVTHDFTVGQKIRFHVPAVRGSSAFGMIELDNIIATVLAIGVADTDGITNTITIDVDTTSYTTFSWPLTAIDRFTCASVCPVGEDSNMFSYTNSDDAPINQAARGIILGAGQQSPAGQTNDVIYWTAGKSNL